MSDDPTDRLETRVTELERRVTWLGSVVIGLVASLALLMVVWLLGDLGRGWIRSLGVFALAAAVFLLVARFAEREFNGRR